MGYLQNYLTRVRDTGNTQLSNAISKTVDDLIPRYVSNFTFKDHVISLLVGDVQGGKTSHMFGLMCAAADEGFGIFLLLTTDNVILQQQTYNRAMMDLCDFCVCDENDYLKFTANNMKKPAVVVLKKNGRILKQWKNNLSSTNFCTGNPLFIVDDEADAASLNTLVNKNKKSAINKVLADIKKTTSSSIYLQVTGTPQALLLQTIQSEWKPYFIYYFEPGSGYLGGNFFFQPDPPACIVFTDNDEGQDLLADDEFPENGLRMALITHLITSGHLFLSGGTVSNFLIHPSVKTGQHSQFAEKIGDYLNDTYATVDDPETIETFKKIYQSLRVTKEDLYSFDDIYIWIRESLENGNINVLIINSVTSYFENVQYGSGTNIIVGGNSLGRGITFPQLQTIYYCRVSKTPQADTMWQHARIFGYDRDPKLVRIFIPPILYKLFSDINATNNNIISQIRKTDSKDIKVFYPSGLKPTRKNVLDKKLLGLYSGNVNYFPFDATNKDILALDKMLEPFGDELYTVNLKLIANILKETGSEKDDWSGDAFAGIVNAFIAENPLAQGILIVRRNRDISKGTGTLLSPNDRKLGDRITDQVVLTMYKITGTKGWNGLQLWIPNIKLPGDVVYYSL